ncbi:MAG TPA: glutamine-hydrolyzing GMP synthase [Candidatus Saccharimonadia bacterium]|nr:glutamine-hydrolyzing GMP synthase [Candidatus Saccharimonadia bacterium]
MILVVDFGSQTAHLIGRRLRDLGVAHMYADPENILADIKTHKPTGVIFSGGPASVYDKGAPTITKKVFDQNLPILGICYGWQLMAKLLGGDVRSAMKEYGPQMISLKANKLVRLPKKTFTVIMSHGDSVVKLPKGFTVVGSTKSVRFAAVQDTSSKLFGIQFHPEAFHTTYGKEVLRSFAQNICKEKIHPFTIKVDEIVESIRTQVGKGKVLCAVSGGGDSTVAAALITKAIGKRCIPVYVESGLMRRGTLELVRSIFTKQFHSTLSVIHAEKLFLHRLKGVTDPEQKRKIIGKLYVDLFEKEAKKYKGITHLGQGTIYSDVIESKGSKKASHIKSHHNVGGLPKNMKFSLIEPVRMYYKDEVRAIGLMMKLPKEIVIQHPFPGPGYAVRIRGEVTSSRLEQEKIADDIVVAELRAAKLYENLFQCFAVMSGAFSTAVKGDARAFAEVVAVRAYESNDVMTSQWANIPYEVMQRISTRIVNEVPNVSRVVYDVTTKPPATMEWE